MNYVICAHNISGEIEDNLAKLGAVPVKLRGFDKFGEFHPLSYHPDMLCFNLEKNKWIFYEGIYAINKKAIDRLNIDAITVKDPESGVYPRDVRLNAAMFGINLMCNIKYTEKKILEYAEKSGRNIIGVKQGYTKCSVCTVDENSIITSDASIYGEAKKNKIGALLISEGHIGLNGYGHGFIGGCSGLISKSKLAFTGNIKLHPDYENIKEFCRGRGVEIFSMSEGDLYDYGSILYV